MGTLSLVPGHLPLTHWIWFLIAVRGQVFQATPVSLPRCGFGVIPERREEGHRSCPVSWNEESAEMGSRSRSGKRELGSLGAGTLRLAIKRGDVASAIATRLSPELVLSRKASRR
jgi:hypothetical protein